MGKSNKRKHFLDHNRLVNQRIQRILNYQRGLIQKLAPGVVYQEEPLPDLGITIPSNVGQKLVVKCLSNIGHILDRRDRELKYCLPYQYTKNAAAIKPHVTPTQRWALRGLRTEASCPLLQPPLKVHSEGTWGEKAQGAGPSCRKRGSKERALTLRPPHTQKSTTFLNCRYLVFLH